MENVKFDYTEKAINLPALLKNDEKLQPNDVKTAFGFNKTKHSIIRTS
jgi:hypothetical protein